jgi:hypothetical protein
MSAKIEPDAGNETKAGYASEKPVQSRLSG